jgi:ABC-2 type transport system permease protein
MFDVWWVMTRNELRGYFRRKASVFWALIFPVFLLTVMLFAFGRSTSLGQVRVSFAGSSATAQACRDEIASAFAASETVKASFVDDDPDLRVAFAADQPTRVSYDFSGALAGKAAARTIEVALIRCTARAHGIEPAAVVQFVNASSKQPLDYGFFFATGILVMAFMIIGMNSTAHGIGALRERNTFKIYVCFPVSRSVFLTSIVCARCVIMLLSTAALLFTARYGFGIQLPLWGSQMLRALPVLVLGAAMLVGFGILLAARGRSLSEIELWSNLVYYPLLFFSDLTIPLTAVPEWMRGVLKLIPTNQFAVALRGVLVDDASYAQLAFPLTTMACWAFVTLTLGTLQFRWHQD